jgi:ABC-type nickel/cobalt efflux system permease component RcnA
MRLFFWLACVVMAALMGADAHANPFISGKPSEASSVALNMFGTPFLQQVLAIQRQIHEALVAQIEALKEGKSLLPLWQLLIFSFAYGVFHVLAPGHGKVIVTSYFIGNEARWKDGLWAGMIMAVGHTITAIAVVAFLYLVLGLTQFGVLAQARYVELIGYGLIMGIGLWLLWKAVTNAPSCNSCGHDHGHDHHHHHHDHKNDGGRGLFAAASLVPCSGSMIILLFTMVNGVLWAGVLAVIAIALGMWITITLLGIAAILLRQYTLEKGSAEAPWKKTLLRCVRVAAALIVVATGGLLFVGTLYSIAA